MASADLAPVVDSFFLPGCGSSMLRRVTRPCPVCAGNQSAPHLAKGELRLVRCVRCGMVYVALVPTEFASGRYYEDAGQDYYLSPAKLESDYSDVRFERELRLFRPYCGGGPVLDVGCSSGGFLFQLRKRYPGTYEVLGTDVSGPPLDYAESRGVPVMRGDFLGQDYGEQRFDAITFWAVLEHLADPGAFLERARGLLKGGGFCFVLVPNFRSAAVRLLGSKYRYIYPQHLNYFTRNTLDRLLAAKGFEVVRIRFTHFNPIVTWQDWRSGGREVTNVERARLLQRTTAYKQRRSMRTLRLLYSAIEKLLGGLGLADNLAVVAKRPG